MASRVDLSDSEGSVPSVNSVLPRPAARTLRSLVVVPPSGRVLGQDGWTAGAGSSHRPAAAAPAANPARAPASAPTNGAGGAGRGPARGAGGEWTLASSRRRRRQPPQEPRSQQQQPRRRRGRGQQLPSRAPVGGAASRIPVALHGCCYNCGDEDHISANCTKPTKCVRCGGPDHISRECQEQRTSSGATPPERLSPAE
jgi:hypothetical protein